MINKQIYLLFIVLLLTIFCKTDFKCQFTNFTLKSVDNKLNFAIVSEYSSKNDTLNKKQKIFKYSNIDCNSYLENITFPQSIIEQIMKLIFSNFTSIDTSLIVFEIEENYVNAFFALDTVTIISIESDEPYTEIHYQKLLSMNINNCKLLYNQNNFITIDELYIDSLTAYKIGLILLEYKYKEYFYNDERYKIYTDECNNWEIIGSSCYWERRKIDSLAKITNDSLRNANIDSVYIPLSNMSCGGHSVSISKKSCEIRRFYKWKG